MISVEPLEVLRYWHYLSPAGWVVSSVTPYVNIPDYPAVDEVVRELAEFGRVVLVDSAQIARAAGNLRAQNMVVVGAASPLLDFTEEQLLTYVRRLFAGKGEKTVEVNCRAFRLGRAAGLIFRGWSTAAWPPLDALRLCQKFAPETIDPAHADGWAAKPSAGRRGALELLLAQEGTVACDRPAPARATARSRGGDHEPGQVRGHRAAARDRRGWGRTTSTSTSATSCSRRPAPRRRRSTA